MTWHYQVIQENGLYYVHEHYDPDGVTETPVHAVGESLDELRHVLVMMLQDTFKYPVKTMEDYE